MLLDHSRIVGSRLDDGGVGHDARMSREVQLRSLGLARRAFRSLPTVLLLSAARFLGRHHGRRAGRDVHQRRERFVGLDLIGNVLRRALRQPRRGFRNLVKRRRRGTAFLGNARHPRVHVGQRRRALLLRGRPRLRERVVVLGRVNSRVHDRCLYRSTSL